MARQEAGVEGWLITPGYRPRAAGQPDDRSIIPHCGRGHRGCKAVEEGTGGSCESVLLMVHVRDYNQHYLASYWT